MQVKLFWVLSPMRNMGFVPRDNGGNAMGYEKEINEWLAEHPDIKISHIEQSASGGSFGPALWLISVWYTRGDGGA